MITYPARNVAAPGHAYKELALSILIVALALPPELSFSLGSLRLTTYRLTLLVFFIPCLFALLNARHLRLNMADLLVMLHGLWVCIALAVTEGIMTGIESGGIYVIETVGAFLIGRICIRNQDDFKKFARFFLGLVCVFVVFGLLETLSHQNILREIFRPFNSTPVMPDTEPRLGLARAFGSFDHPILFGVFCAAGFSMAFYCIGQGKWRQAQTGKLCSAVVVATICSLSAGPLVALALQVGLSAWEVITRGLRYRWMLPLCVVTFIWVAIDVLSNRSPVLVFISYLSFSESSGYARVRIFEYGFAEVIRNPFFGIGFGEWVRPSWMSSSIDNFWLLTAVKFGIPAVVLLWGAMGYLVIRAATQKNAPQTVLLSRRAWGFTLAGLAVAGCTVAFWNSLLVLFFLILGSGAWLADTRQDTNTAPALSSRKDRPKRAPQRLF
jgi:hypothetical protein